MKRSRRRYNRTILLMLVVFLLVICIGGLFFQVSNLKTWTISKFGKPADSLNQTDILVYSYRLSMEQDELLKPIFIEGNDKQFIVEMGESIQSISNRMETEGYIRNAKAFINYLIYSGMDTRIQAGEYKISSGLNAVQIASKLMDSTPSEIKFGILPGWRLEEVAEALNTSGLEISEEDFVTETNNSLYLEQIGINGDVKSLEGFLYPSVYQISRYVNTGELIQILLDEFSSKVDPIKADFSKNNLSQSQAVTLASIIQKEAIHEDEMPMIASVFYNRLANGMKLESDPTTQYAIGYNPNQKTWWTNPLSSDDLQIQSPYNTYVINGLPPGPICNPGISALRAVANPEQSDYFYFRAKCDGSGYHNFSKNLDEHISFACE